MGAVHEKIAEYSDYLNKHDIPQNTILSYQRDLKKMADHLLVSGVTEGQLVTASDLRAYLRSLENENKRPATIARALAAMKAFFRWLVQAGEIPQSPAERLKPPRVEKAIPHILSKEEVVRLLQQPDGKSEKSVRDRAMMELLYATGIRVSELVQLEQKDVNMSMEYILCRQNGRERVIPFGKTAKLALQEYLETVRPLIVTDSDCGLMFTNMSGQQMSRQGFWKIIKQYGREAGIQGEITPHTLRHSFAAHLVNNGADLYAVQEMMGYMDLSAAQVYSRMRNTSVRETYLKAHPRE